MTEKLDFNLKDLGGMNDPFFVIHKLKQVCQAVDSIKQNYATYKSKVDRLEEKIKKFEMAKIAADIIKETFNNARFIKSEEPPKKYLKGWEAVKAITEGKKIKREFWDSIYNYDHLSVGYFIEYNDWEIVE